MRNVTIWGYGDVDGSMPPFARVFEYKGYKGTLNEFLFPNFVLRDGCITARDRDVISKCIPFQPGKKGMVVVMGYNSTDSMVRGEGEPLVVFNSFEHAVYWLVTNMYEFINDESAKRRAEKQKVIDVDARRREYESIARRFASSRCQGEASAPVDPTVKVSHPNVVDNTDLNNALDSLRPKAPTPSGWRQASDKDLSLWQRFKKFLGL